MKIKQLYLVFFFLILLYSCVVYVFPIYYSTDYSDAFDAFSYGQMLKEDPEQAVVYQPFLKAYPSALSLEYLPIYAGLLHVLLLSVPLFFANIVLKKNEFNLLIIALLLPESLIFLSGVTKEGLGIVAVLSGVVSLFAFIEKKRVIFILLFLYSFIISEFSRPYLGFVFTVPFLLAIVSILKINKKIIWFIVLSSIYFLIWILFIGPLSNDFTEKYQDARNFLFAFEDIMRSDSDIKNFIRQIFMTAFTDKEPSISTIVILLGFAVLKSFVYLIALPIISLPHYSTLPAQTWAVVWQFSTSVSTFIFIALYIKIKTSLHTLNIREKSLFVYGSSLLFVIALSTPFFHVRYRAPAMIVIIFGLLLLQKKVKKWQYIIGAFLPVLIGLLAYE